MFPSEEIAKRILNKCYGEVDTGLISRKQAVQAIAYFFSMYTVSVEVQNLSDPLWNEQPVGKTTYLGGVSPRVMINMVVPYEYVETADPTPEEVYEVLSKAVPMSNPDPQSDKEEESKSDDEVTRFTGFLNHRKPDEV